MARPKIERELPAMAMLRELERAGVRDEEALRAEVARREAIRQESWDAATREIDALRLILKVLGRRLHGKPPRKQRAKRSAPAAASLEEEGTARVAPLPLKRRGRPPKELRAGRRPPSREFAEDPPPRRRGEQPAQTTLAATDVPPFVELVLEAVYRRSPQGEPATTAQIVADTGLPAPKVMLAFRHECGWFAEVPGGWALSSAGRQMARSASRR